jgi:hypothetical protein
MPVCVIHGLGSYVTPDLPPRRTCSGGSGRLGCDGRGRALRRTLETREGALGRGPEGVASPAGVHDRRTRRPARAERDFRDRRLVPHQDGGRFDPRNAVGVNGALAALHAQPSGPVLLGVVAAGLLAFMVFLFFEARFRRL